MPEYTPLVETLRVDALELGRVSDVIAFMEARVEEAKDRLKTNNGIPVERGMLFEVSAWQRVGPNFECDVTLHLPLEKGTLAAFHDRVKGNS